MLPCPFNALAGQVGMASSRFQQCNSDWTQCIAQKNWSNMVQRTKFKRILLSLAMLGMVFNLTQDRQPEPAGNAVDARFLADYIQRTHSRIHPVDRDRLVQAILKESRRLDFVQEAWVDQEQLDGMLFLTAVIETESTFKVDAVSSADARGYMQLMPATARWMGERFGIWVPEGPELFEPEANLSRGVIFLNHLWRELRDPRLVCLAYNAGLGNVQRGYYEERYWVKVLTNYRRLKAERSSQNWLGKELTGVKSI